MAGMFYSLEEVAAKLNISENQIKEYVNQGKLREFQDGPNQLFKVDEVNALAAELDGTAVEGREVSEPAQAEEKQPDSAEPEEDTGSDIELDIGDTDIIGAQQEDTGADKQEPDEDTGEIELDLGDSSEQGEEPQPQQPEQKKEEPAQPAEADSGEMELDLDDSGEQEEEPEPEQPEQKKEEPAQPAEDDSGELELGEVDDEQAEQKKDEDTLGELSLADTHDGSDETAAGGEGINILDESDSEYKLADDTLGETKAGEEEASLEEIEGDVNLDSFGSGSGLLDLSLQADDTSLGGILDEIYAPEGEEPKSMESAGEGVAAEADSVMPDDEKAGEAETSAAAAAVGYVEPEPDTISNALGIMLFVPLLALVYMSIVVIAGFVPGVFAGLTDYVWYVMGALAVIALGIAGGGYMMETSASSPKKPKAEKKPKAGKKAKKAKK